MSISENSMRRAILAGTGLFTLGSLLLISQSNPFSQTYQSPATTTPDPWTWLDRPTDTHLQVADSTTGCLFDSVMSWKPDTKTIEGTDEKNVSGLEAKVRRKAEELRLAGAAPNGFTVNLTAQQGIIADQSIYTLSMAEYFAQALQFTQSHPQLTNLDVDLDPQLIVVNGPDVDLSDYDGKIIVGHERVKSYNLALVDKNSGDTFILCHAEPQRGSECTIDYDEQTKKITGAHVFLSTREVNYAVLMPFAEFIPYALRHELLADIERRGKHAAHTSMEALSESIALQLGLQLVDSLGMPVTASELLDTYRTLPAESSTYAKLPQARKWLVENSMRSAIELYLADPESYDRAIDRF